MTAQMAFANSFDLACFVHSAFHKVLCARKLKTRGGVAICLRAMKCLASHEYYKRHVMLLKGKCNQGCGCLVMWATME